MSYAEAAGMGLFTDLLARLFTLVLFFSGISLLAFHGFGNAPTGTPYLGIYALLMGGGFLLILMRLP